MVVGSDEATLLVTGLCRIPVARVQSTLSQTKTTE